MKLIVLVLVVLALLAVVALLALRPACVDERWVEGMNGAPEMRCYDQRG